MRQFMVILIATNYGLAFANLVFYLWLGKWWNLAVIPIALAGGSYSLYVYLRTQ